MRFIKPLYEELLVKILSKHSKVITLEDGTIHGGMGSAILEFISEKNYSIQVKRLGVPDKFVDHGTVEELYKECGMDCDSIVSTVKEMVGSKVLYKAGVKAKSA